MTYNRVWFYVFLLGSLIVSLHTVASLADSRNQAELTKLYNSNVVKAEYVKRPMTSSDGRKRIPLIPHAGVRLTLDNGDKYLLHKGPDYGKSSDTVITPASNMKQSTWTAKKSAPVQGKIVNDFMKNALPDKKWNAWNGNHCINAAKRAFSQTRK
ncbi:uncharacterized protein LOC128554997 [Mercenaria mercenaria]|uniref:uncharacterized protein LOC128554997 n=1 Tax=Mercenaria mercenaria TaxID=6596 RepID=UPI00234FA53A|nr:uncharacterized protein LOC128554997 [Mercenaria mercenaria]